MIKLSLTKEEGRLLFIAAAYYRERVSSLSDHERAVLLRLVDVIARKVANDSKI